MRLEIRPAATYWRIIYDTESEKWGYKSRTFTIRDTNGELFKQLPAVYGYSDVPDPKPDNYRVWETGMDDEYYRINDSNIVGQYDGRGTDRCESYLFGDANAIYNRQTEDGRGFPFREYVTMSGNILKEIEWVSQNGVRYLKFETVRPTDDLRHMTYKSHPDKVHQHRLVTVEDNVTVTKPTINRDGFVFYFLTSKNGYAYIPESYVRPA